MLRSKRNIFIAYFVVGCICCQFWSAPGWCADPIDDLMNPPSPLTEEQRATLGRIGVARAFFMPETQLDTFARSKGAGTAKGAAEGFLQAMSQMGSCSGSFCGVAIIIWAATAGTAGTVYGAIQGYLDAMPAEEAQKVEQSLDKLYTSLNLQERLQQKILKIAHEKTTKGLISIEEYGPKVSGETVDYHALRKNAIDSVLEISVITFGFHTWPRGMTPPENVSVGGKDPSLALFFNTHPRLIRLSDSKVIYRPRRDIRSDFIKSTDWEADNFKIFTEQMDELMESIAHKIVEDIFITYVLPEETPP